MTDTGDGQAVTSNNVPTDVLFVTHLQIPRDKGAAEVYGPLRLAVEGRMATIPLLRAVAAERSGKQLPQSAGAAGGGPAVLTPIYLQDYLERRGLSFRNIACLETGEEVVRQAVEGEGVGVIALSTTWLPTLCEGAGYVREAAARLRVLAPGVPVVAGGVGVRKSVRARKLLLEGLLTEMSLSEAARYFLLIDPELDRDLDAVVVSEGGEATLAAIAQRVKEGKEFRDLPNLAIPEKGGYRFTGKKPETTDLETETVDWSRHLQEVAASEIPVRTGIGCPFSCGFCDFTGLYRPRLRSLESVIGELRSLRALPAPRRVVFIDDNFAVSRKQLEKVTRLLVAERLELSWRAFMRADVIDWEMAELLRESGCRECLLGMESGDPQILRNMDKRLDPERALEAVRLLDEQGICTQSLFVIGFPGECESSIERTASFLSAYPSGPRAGAFHRFYPFRFELTPLCAAASPEQRQRFSLKGMAESWSHLTMSSAEAADAVRQLFLQVTGPTMLYLEIPPADWPLAASRRVMELRDAAQRDAQRNGIRPGVDALLDAVIDAEQTAAA